jgi:hypothetical protein
MRTLRAGVVTLATLVGLTCGVAAHAQTTGWSALANTKIRTVCAADNGFPGVGGSTGCPAITSAWSGGAMDTKRNRLIVFGGGHNDYYGNELYAINVDAQTVQRLTDPATPNGTSGCPTSLANGTQPNSRHTYDGLEYVASVDKLFVFGGSLACSTGNFGADTWLFNFATNTWEAKSPTGTIPNAIPGVVTAYDSVSGLVYLYDNVFFYSYNAVTNVWTRLSANQAPIGYHMNATIDPKRRKFVILGWDSIQGTGSVYTIDIGTGSTYTLNRITTTGGSGLINTEYPGVDYDSTADRIVAWGQDTPNVVYSLNLDTNAWTATTVAGGPAPAGQGTHGRWRYSPTSNAFVLANSVDANAVLYRSSTGGGTAPDTTAPTAPTAVSGSAPSATTASLTWTAATDNIGVVGYRVSRCTGTTCTPATVVGTPATPSYSDSALTASTTYRYSVVAIDAAGNVSAASAIASVTTPAAAGTGGSTTADTDFAARCSAPGVVKCVGFDNTTTDIVRNVSLFPDGAGVFRAGLDTTTKASGGGALRFDLPPPPHSGANIAGRWTNEGNPVFGRVFSENSTFYLQFRQRLSPEMVQDSWANSTWKNIIIHYDNQTCGAIELTTSNYYGSPLAQMNTDCGGRGFWTTTDGSAWTDQLPKLMQQGDYMNCAYGTNYATNCLNWPANEWFTIYYKVHIGTWDQPNSSVEAFVAREGATSYKQFIKVMNMSLSCNATVCNTSPGKDQGYNNVTFTPYMTGLPTTTGPSTTAYMWVDELIVSTQPIAVPMSKPRPSPPSSFTVQ